MWQEIKVKEKFFFKMEDICIKYLNIKDKELAYYILMDSGDSDNALLENDKFKNINFLFNEEIIKNFWLMNSEELLINNFVQNFLIYKSNNAKIVVLVEVKSINKNYWWG